MAKARAALLLLAAPAAAALASLRLITLDLDDTLWPTGPVVRAANAAVAEALGADADDLQARLKAARSGSLPQKPSYSEARIQAIESWLHERDGTAEGRRTAAEDFFALWLSERHAAAERLLFDGAADAVAAVRTAHPDALIAAVTNGRGDPLAMPALRSHFDFTVSAEDPGIWPERKPAAAPFLAALRTAGIRQPTPAQWAHIGDDLINDVKAAKELGAWAVWLHAQDDDGGAEAGGAAPATSPDDAAAASYWYSTMSGEERAARRAEAEGALGAADATIADIRELPAALSPQSRRRGRACPIPGLGA